MSEYEIIKKKENIITVRHNPCGTTFETTQGTYDNLSNIGMCPTCNQGFEPRFIKKLGTEFEVVGISEVLDHNDTVMPFRAQQIELKHLSEQCNYYTRIVTPKTLVSTKDNWCPICRAYDRQKDFASRLKKLCGDEYSVLEPYRGSRTKIKIKHNKCGYEWEVRPDNFLGNKAQEGSRCPRCQHKKKSEPVKMILPQSRQKAERFYMDTSQKEAISSP